MTSNVALSMDALRTAVAELPNDRLTITRQAALEQLGIRGTPTPRHEDWKYTDLAPVIEISNAWLAGDATSDDPALLDATISDITSSLDAHWLVISNGQVDASSVTAARAAGVNASLLSESDATPAFDDPLSDLNVALLRDGLHIGVSTGDRPSKPIGLLIVDSALGTDSVSQVNVNITLAANSGADIVEYHASIGDARHYANSIVNLTLADAARANYVRLQDRSMLHSQTGRLNVAMDRNARIDHCAFDFGGKLVRNDLAIEINGPGAHADFHGLYLADNDQHIDNHTRVDHKVGPASSEQEYRGILGGLSRCVWNGKAIVHIGADGTDAEQANHNLLLSERAEIDAKPELEIYADEVKCAHGTTVGQLDENALYYLRTRGLDKRAARRLLTRAFAETIVELAPIGSVRDSIRAQVIERLNLVTHGEDE